MPRSALLIFMLLLCGCLEEENSLEDQLLRQRALFDYTISNWQHRETQAMESEPIYLAAAEDFELPAHIGFMIARHHQQIEFDHHKANFYYWQTAAETADSGRGVCIDQAIYTYIQLRQEGIPDDCLAILAFFNGTLEGHAELGIRAHPRDDYLICENGVLVLPEPNPMFAFNLFERWWY